MNSPEEPPAPARRNRRRTFAAFVIANVIGAHLRAIWLILIAAGVSVRGASTTPLMPVVEIEENLYEHEPANNGAGPMWCHGSTCLVRLGQDVVASGLDTLTNTPPLNNCRWTLWRRDKSGWRQTAADTNGCTREPCPLVCFPEASRLFLSANPTLTPPGHSGGGPARPEILEFKLPELGRPLATLAPEWNGAPQFTEHSYRSFAADGRSGELVLFQNIGYTHAEFAFRDKNRRWPAKGRLDWPWGAEYDKPQPIRVCYPNVALIDHAVHFAGVSDIVEPYAKWRDFKKKLTGSEWDYYFRRLFYTWSPDIRDKPFANWLEIASRDKTCGWVMPGDMWVASDGRVHIVWTERALDERLRGKFFPAEKQRHEMNYAIVRHGRVAFRRTLAAVDEGRPDGLASMPRFHVLPDKRLLVFYYVSGVNSQGKRISENRMIEILRDGRITDPVTVPLQHPLTSYFTATVRAGCAPSRCLDLLGTRAGLPTTISYARIRL